MCVIQESAHRQFEIKDFRRSNRFEYLKYKVNCKSETDIRKIINLGVRVEGFIEIIEIK